MSNAVDNTEDIIDSRDVIERIEYLENEAIDQYELEKDTDGEDLPNDFDATHWLTNDEADELRALRNLAEDGASLPDWEYGETLIRDTYFKDYAMDLAEELGAIPSEYTWPTSCIDWDQATRELRMDYTSLDFDGVTYWARS